MGVWGMVLVVLASVCFAIHIFSFAVVAVRSIWQPQGDVQNWQNEGVTILRPVAGLENNIERTLASAFMLDHRYIEVIFCVAREDDLVIPLVNEIMARYPHVPSTLLIGNDPVSRNPKLNNLIKGWNAARYNWIVMTDSNVLMPKDYIARLFGRWKKDTGLVVSPPLGTEPANFAANLEAAFLNSYQARWQLTSDTIGNGFAQGKTLFWHREVLEQGGGILALSEEIAEDAAATKVVRRQGLKVRLSAMPFAQPLGEKNLKSIWDRQVRWAKLRRDSFALFFYLELLSGIIFPSLCLIGAMFAGVATGWSLLWFLVGWYGVEVCVTAFAGWPMSLQQIRAIIIRDFMLLWLWFSAFGKGGYQWQGHKVDIGTKE